MNELIKSKVRVICCDEKYNPSFELESYNSNCYKYKKIKQQLSRKQETKNKLWKLIISEKLKNSSKLLKRFYFYEEAEVLFGFATSVEENDRTQREGHGAKIYFHRLFGSDFSRKNDLDVRNKYLNYGYAIIASAINREIAILGFINEIGIFHIGETNPFNLTYDFIEPLRAIIDYYVVKKEVNEENYKSFFASILEISVIYEKKKMFLNNAIHLYIQNCINILNNDDLSKICFIEYGI